MEQSGNENGKREKRVEKRDIDDLKSERNPRPNLKLSLSLSFFYRDSPTPPSSELLPFVLKR